MKSTEGALIELKPSLFNDCTCRTCLVSFPSKLHMHMILKSGISRGNRINSDSYNHASKGDSYKDME